MKKNKSLLWAILAIAIMAGGGCLLSLTINSLYYTTTAFATLSLSLLAVFLYVAGATLIRHSLRGDKQSHGTFQTAGTPSTEGKNIIVTFQHDGVDSGLLIAFLLIAAGALLFCFNAEILNPAWKSFFISWPMLVFAVGAICVCKRHLITGFILVAVGIFFLMPKAAAIYPNDMFLELIQSNFWPAVFVVSGIVIILSFLIRPKACNSRHPKGNWTDEYTPSESENNDGKINYRLVFSGTEQVILDPVFKGGTVETVFGGLELDLRRTTLAEGSTVLYVKTVFGGVEIKAPDTWDIEIKSKTVAGGISDTRLKSREPDHTRKLVIYANCTFGGITIR